MICSKEISVSIESLWDFDCGGQCFISAQRVSLITGEATLGCVD